VGWALGIGRIGSIVGPLIGGLLIQLHWTNESLFVAAAVPAALACLAAIVIAVEYKGRIDATA
jgi:AAHS family 4-hydroxybenzoate transporter-like MFS transporter